MSEIVGRRTLIAGDAGAGKTRLTRRLLEEALGMGLEGVTVIDMAPGAVDVNGSPVGGTLAEADEYDVRCLGSDDIRTPRLSARTAEELLQLAEHNMREVDGLLEAFEEEPSRTLFVNDISIYLQRGDLERLWRALESAETVVANGYLGDKLGEDLGTGLSRDERERMEELASRMDVVIRL